MQEEEYKKFSERYKSKNFDFPIDFHREVNPNYPLHSHKFIEIITVESGELSVIQGENVSEATLHFGDIYIALPHTVHGLHSLDGCCACTFLRFECVTLRGKKLVSPVVRKDEIHDDVLYCAEALRKEINTSSVTNGLLSGYIAVILSRLVETAGIVAVAEEENVMHEAITYMESHFGDNLTLQNVARKIGVNKYALSRKFADMYGCNFNTYLNNIRVDYTKKLLLSTSGTISDILYRCGFKSECTFYRAFKVRNSVTPNEYRKMFVGA